jgi:4a-hydroxytetrahydrobiopterin dehydratase
LRIATHLRSVEEQVSVLAGQALAHCAKGTAPLSKAEQAGLLDELRDWAVISDNGIDKLQKSWLFRDFASAQVFVLQVGGLAQAANHHPAILLEWGRVTVSWWTHTIGGLHHNDFIMAARCNTLS